MGGFALAEESHRIYSICYIPDAARAGRFEVIGLSSIKPQSNLEAGHFVKLPEPCSIGNALNQPVAEPACQRVFPPAHLSHAPRLHCYCAGSLHAASLVIFQGLRRIWIRAEACGQHYSRFYRLASSLPHSRRGRVRRVPKQSHTPIAPTFERVLIVNVSPYDRRLIRCLDDFFDRLMPVTEAFKQTGP